MSPARAISYSKAISSKRLSGAELAYLHAARDNEWAHYKALAGVVGKAAPKNLRFAYPGGSFASARSIGSLGQALESAFVGAYLGAVTALRSNDLKGVAAAIGANESRHPSVLSNIAAGTIVGAPSFPNALTAVQATSAVKQFLAT